MLEGMATKERSAESPQAGEAPQEGGVRRSDDEVTVAMNRAAAEVGNIKEGFASEVAKRVLRSVEW